MKAEPDYSLSFDKNLLDTATIHSWLTDSYWSPGIPLETVQQAIANSLCIGLFHSSTGQAGFARAVTDSTTFAYVADVWIDTPHRGKGLARMMVNTLLAHQNLQGLRRTVLATRDAHSLYAQLGFSALGNPDIFMEILKPDIYLEPDDNENNRSA